MELLQLQYFKTIAECQHITKAANKLMISQPSLSNTLSRIEAELGVQLFDRQGRNIVLNQYGKIVLEHAHNILRELDNIRTEIDAMQQRQEKVITIASTDSMYLREWLPSFIRANPDLTIRHTVSTIEKIETDLLNGVIDFGISSVVSDNPSFEHYTLWEDEYIVITPHPNDLPSEPVRNFADFAKMPFVALPALDYQSRSIDIMSNAVDITPNIIFEGERELLERVMLPLHASIVALRSTIKED
ncbi:MAG: LysR family transcriptional regulator, partial [Peptococcaceae bacterium]|nr:LysR family transcriptional regulator [Peptococcaceae bacterium]